MDNSTPVFHIISNTHWDREWRFPFQRNRQMLVDMIDAVLEILESEPEYRAFHLDSQSIVLKDYLEIKPQNADRIIQLTKENRLLHGPWYILPEEFQVGGENLIRNLLLGHKTSKMYGGVSKIGYSPFSWGQISQLPQLYKEFNINLIMFYRGINSLDSPKAEFFWEGADGTQMISSRFSTMPRYNFYFYIYRPVVHNEGFYDVEYLWQRDSTPFHFADRQQHPEDYFIISPHTEYYPENIEKQVNKIIEDQADDFTTLHKIWMEGHDSSGPNRQTLDIIRDIRKKMPHIQVYHSTLEEYADALAREVDVQNLVKVSGERRSAQNNNRCGNLFGYTTSARMYLKQANFDAERWLQYYAEPFNVFSGLMGRDINDRYPETAWELIVQNSAHDSIGGCSLDAIHEDMMMRYKHAIQISKGVFERALKYLTAQMNTSSFPGDGNQSVYLTLVNTTNFSRTEVVEAFIDIPENLDQGDFDVFDSKGQPLEKSVIASYRHQPILEQMINRPMHFNMIRYHTWLKVNHVPSFGMKVFKIAPCPKALVKNVLADQNHELENEFLRVSIRTDGTLDLFDKQTQTLYPGIAYFESEGESGHAWVHQPIGPVVSTKGVEAKIIKSYSSGLYNEFVIEHLMLLPASLSARKSEQGALNENIIVVRIGLASGQKHLSFNIQVNNCSESHRLRLMIPAHLNATHTYGEGQFDVVKRNLHRPDTSDWIEQPMYDFPMHHFVDLTDGYKGLAVLADGLKEYEVLNDASKTLAVTLLRTFEYKINPAAPQDYCYEKGAQMLGTSDYHLAIFPHQGDWQQGKVYKESFIFNYPLRLVQTGKLNGCEDTELQMMHITPVDLVFGTLKKPENDQSNSLVLRVYNPTDTAISGSVCFMKPIRSVQKITLEEIPCDFQVPINENDFDVEAPPKKILSYLIEF